MAERQGEVTGCDGETGLGDCGCGGDTGLLGDCGCDGDTGLGDWVWRRDRVR